jgi:concentrative nucleoside transporter, CNT family
MPDHIGLRFVSLLGLATMLALAWLVSENRRVIPWRVIFWGLGIQFAIGILLLLTPLEDYVFAGMGKAVELLSAASAQGAGLLFGKLTDIGESGPMMAFQVLPVIILVSAISALLYHFRIIQAVVHVISWVMRRTLKTSGAETFCAAMLIFLGIESVSTVRGYLQNMTRSELCTIMTTFMATIAGSVLVIYAQFGVEPGHLLAASLMSAPAAILISKIMVPETGTPETAGKERVRVEVDTQNSFDALSRGATEGMTMALSVGAMLIVFIALIYLVDHAFLALVGRPFTAVMGLVFRPFAFLLGVPLKDVPVLAELLGTKTVLNEFIAYEQLRPLVEGGTLAPRTVTIATYALCGFANPGSLGIAIAALAALVPERRKEVTSLGLRSLIGGTLACFSTACVAGILLHG